MINIFIPYSYRRDKLEHLRYVLRSIEKNIPSCRIIIYGDECPKWIQNVEFIEVQRWYPELAKKHWSSSLNYECYFDSANKIRKFCQDYMINEFICTYDDIFFVRKVDEEQLKSLTTNVAHSKITEENIERVLSKDKHGKTILTACTLLKKRTTKDIYNYETHSPRWYCRASLENMFNKYKLEKMIRPYAIATLYYNLYFRKPADTFQNNNIYTHGYGKSTYHSLKENYGDKYFLNINLGIKQRRETFIHKIFPDKCKYEK